MPQTFQTQPQKISPTKIGDRVHPRRAAAQPRRQQEAFEAGDHQRHDRHNGRHPKIPELEEGDDCGAAGHDDGTEVGDRIEDAGEQAPQRRLLEAKPAEGQPRRDADERAGEELHEQERFDLPVDVLEDLDGDSSCSPATARRSSRACADRDPG